MPTLETESDSRWVAKVWRRKSGPLNLSDTLKEDHRSIALASIFGFATAGLILGVAVDSASNGDLAGAGLGIGLAGFLAWFGLDSLDVLDCELRENHECRRCRKETERWRADSEEER